MKNTQDKGITLVALIIMITIMLILSGLIIRMVVRGGAIDKADEAAITTELSQIKEAWVRTKTERSYKKISNPDEELGEMKIDVGMYERKKVDKNTYTIEYDDKYIYFFGEQQPDRDIAIALGYKTEKEPEEVEQIPYEIEIINMSKMTNMSKGQTRTLEASVNPLGANVIPPEGVTVLWTSSNSSIIPIDLLTGYLVVVGTGGSSVITARISGTSIQATCTIMIK